MTNINLHLADKNGHCVLCWHQLLVSICCSAFVNLALMLKHEKKKSIAKPGRKSYLIFPSFGSLDQHKEMLTMNSSELWIDL